MHVFLLTIIPLVYFVNEYICHDRKIDREQGFCIFWGFVIACIYCLLDFFAVGSHHEWTNSLSRTWGHNLVTGTILPVIVCLVPVILARDSLRAKVQFVFPVLAAFLTVFLPYSIISDNTAPDFFNMIFYPLMTAVTVFNIDTAASVFDEKKDVKDFLWLRCLIAFVAILSGLFLPSLFQALYFLKMAGVGTYVFIAIFILGSAALRPVSVIFLS